MSLLAAGIAIMLIQSGYAQQQSQDFEFQPLETKAKAVSKPQASPDKKVSNIFYDTPIRDVLMDIAAQTGVTDCT